ncbi:hypothetical protein ACFT2C_05435 [Promicromonospora sp. NPDC057138]|uniref:hypothetical protein n=1 Tax=Promicromonospora sp. NPDC057138 TaxID=3346031 RepID=UPI00363B6CFB
MTVIAPPVPLVAQLRAVVERLHPRTYPVSIRATLDGTGSRLTSCALWTGDFDALWAHRTDLPAALGHTMLDLERSLLAVGYIYALTPSGRAKWRYDPEHGGLHWLEITKPW